MCIRFVENFYYKRKYKKLEKDENTIRIAIVGNVSAGKSFLIRDLGYSLTRLGVGEFDFEIKDHSKSGDKTDVYLCRSKSAHFYEASFKDSKKIQILDMPGEAFDADTKKMFDAILKGLTKVEFDEEEFTKGKESVYILKYKAQKQKDNEHQGGHSQQNPADHQDSDVETKDSNAGKHSLNNLDDKIYHSVDDIEQYCVDAGYTNRRERRVTGREVVLNFLKYNTDSVIESIKDAVRDNRIPIKPRYKQFLDQTLNQKKLFFWFYTFLSTDIIFCHRLAEIYNSESSNSKKQEAPISKTEQPQGVSPIRNVLLTDLYNIKSVKNSFGVKSNYYLVYRAVDMMMNENILQGNKNGLENNNYIREIRNKDDSKSNLVISDIVYSIVANNLFRFIFGGEVPGILKNTDRYKFNNEEIGILIERQNLDTKESTEKENTESKAHAEEENSNAIKAMRSCLYSQVGEFARKVTKQSINANDKSPWYVFFTSSAIDTNYYIHENDDKTESGFNIVNYVGINGQTSLCFGTQQLALSLLYRSLKDSTHMKYGENKSDEIKYLERMITGTEQK